MRLTKTYFALAVVAGVIGGAMSDTAQADPYKWCALYGNGWSGPTNCYFLTLEQCRAAVSGAGGFCAENPFYDGRPQGTSPAPAQSKTQPQPRN
jgi:hypothetical protein